jgi:Holliday junction resolvase RusA-like endonuclease
MSDESGKIRFVIPVCPMSLQTSGKQMIIRNGKPIFFKTQKATDYQKIIRLYARNYRPKQPWDCPIDLTVIYYFGASIAPEY